MPDNNAWVSAQPSDEARELLFAAARARQDAIEKSANAHMRLGFKVGIAGLIVGLMGVGDATYTHIKTPVPDSRGYVAVLDPGSGRVTEAIPTKNAPNFFPESVRRRDLQDFITACETYVPQTWRDVQWHNCMVHATPDEQKRIAADIGQSGPRYPVRIFGGDGAAYPNAFLDFQDEGEVGTGPNRVFSYMVRYSRTETVNGITTYHHWTARVTFSYHPELKMNDDDRRLNENAFQATSFSTVKD